MRIQHNIMAMNAYRNYTNNVSAMKKNLEKLSSGYKINRAGDDAAGLAISEKMRAQITGLETAQKNAKDGISLVQTAEGALTEVHDMLNRMVELATQSANGTYDNDTDRFQMQKEVNQLLSEIDRIADSANFNGIKLLDGTLGMNTDAFKVLGAADGVAAVAGQAITGAVTAGASNASTTHISATGGSTAPSYSVDVADLAITVGTNGGSAVDLTVNFGGSDVTVSLDAASGAATSVTYTASQIAQKIVDAFNSGKNAAGASKTAGSIAGLMFTAQRDGTKINFTYQGVATAGGGEVDASAALTDAKASTFNAVFGGDFSITTDGNELGTTGRIDCNIFDAVEAVAAGDIQRAGIQFTLANSAIVDGNKIIIDDQTFTIKMSGSGAAGANDIDLRDLVEASATAAALMRETVLQLSHKVTGNFNVQSANPDTGVINLEQTTASYNNGAGKLYDYDKLSKLVSVTDAGTPAKAAGTKLQVTASAIKEGNVISVTDGSVTTKYVFGTGTDVTTGNNQVKYVASKTAAALLAAIGSKAELSTDTNDPAGTIIIRSGDVTAKTGPTVLGKGLTLQIGDTSDDFNQLNVSVQDMHSASIGVGKLDISTEEAAQLAINKIKNAINVVSDVRGTLGATQNRLDHTINNLSVMTENIQDAESTIRDTDVAEEMMAYTKNNILIQSAQAMLAQANQVPQGVLQLLQ